MVPKREREMRFVPQGYGLLPGSAVDAIPIRGPSDAAGSNELSQDFSDVAGADARGVAQLALREWCFSFG